MRSTLKRMATWEQNGRQQQDREMGNRNYVH